jgi:hypothetical protein
MKPQPKHKVGDAVITEHGEGVVSKVTWVKSKIGSHKGFYTYHFDFSPTRKRNKKDLRGCAVVMPRKELPTYQMARIDKEVVTQIITESKRLEKPVEVQRGDFRTLKKHFGISKEQILGLKYSQLVIRKVPSKFYPE